jgi:hypothetical protein
MLKPPEPQYIGQTVDEYNSSAYGKAWAIVAMTWRGAAYCLDCICDWPTYEHDDIESPMPVFSSDEYEDMTCDSCHDGIYAPLSIGG